MKGVKGDFEVRYTEAARDDLLRLFDFLLARAKTAEDLDAAQFAIDTLTIEVESHLSRTPFIFRKAGPSPFLRELVTPFRGAGYVALYDRQRPGSSTSARRRLSLIASWRAARPNLR